MKYYKEYSLFIIVCSKVLQVLSQLVAWSIVLGPAASPSTNFHKNGWVALDVVVFRHGLPHVFVAVVATFVHLDGFTRHGCAVHVVADGLPLGLVLLAMAALLVIDQTASDVFLTDLFVQLVSGHDFDGWRRGVGE